ncbi:NTF2 fold immunity protein [Pseudomonas sp. NPDC089996]|uniref:NTF2 fold immunity protein n=1 Tax=Pseudomonas sp. NPDC089996 TaxID=3364474 RepID=UPI00380F07F9
MQKYSVTELSKVFGKTLRDFMREMYDWEVKYYQKSIEALGGDSSEVDLEEVMREDLLKIFRKFVLPGGRNYDRVESLVCGRCPEYDEKNDQVEVVEVNQKKIAVVIKKTKGLAALFRLTFAVDKGVIMVSGRDLQSGRNWQETYI